MITLASEILANIKCICGKLSSPLEVTVTNTPLEVEPSAAFEALFTDLSSSLGQDISAQTTAIATVVEDTCAEKLTALTGIANRVDITNETLINGISVSSTQTGAWQVEVSNDLNLAPNTTSALANAIAAALSGLEVSLGDTSVPVAMEGQDGILQVEVTNTALDVNATIAGQPVQVEGSVGIDGLVTLDTVGLRDALDGLTVNTGLEDFFAANTLAVTLGGEELNVNFSGVIASLATIDENTDEVETLLQGVIDQQAETVDLQKVRSRVTDGSITTIAAPYRSVSITALSDDVTIDGQAIPLGFTESIGSNRNEQFTENTTIAGADYFVTSTNIL